MSFPFVKGNFTPEEFRLYVRSLPTSKWRGSKIVWHNTAAPSLKQWIASAQKDRENGLRPGISRINSLEAFFRDNQGWSGGPHLFVANDFIWVMNPLTDRGTHSPSFNATAFGIEMIGDFSVEDDETGAGFEVKQNTIYATAVLCEVFGIDPQTSIFLHKEDPRTTHDCPGKNIARDKQEMINDVLALMSGGEHDSERVGAVIAGEVPKAPTERHGVVTVRSLNFRKAPGVMGAKVGSLTEGDRLTILDEAKNGNDSWLRVRTHAGYLGWVSGRYVKMEN